MEDEFDDLLNEVETKFCATRERQSLHPHRGHLTTTVPESNPGAKKKTKDNCEPSSRLKKKQSALDNTIDDILQDDPSDTAPSPRPVGDPDATSLLVRSGSEKKGEKKCFPVFLGGSSVPQGLSTAVNSRACNELRCTECDFKVSAFENFKWISSVDYLFLRNNMPDFHRLQPKLIKQKGSRAYACQCKWRTVQGELTNLQTETDIKWVCGKH